MSSKQENVAVGNDDVESIETGKKKHKKLVPAEPTKYVNFNIDKHCIALMQSCPFFASISRYVRKLESVDIPTAGVMYDKETDDIVLLYNPEFMERVRLMSNGDAKVAGILTHEFYHLVFDHLGHRRRDPKNYWNVSTDAAINCLILSSSGDLPPGLILPGLKMTDIDGNPVETKEGTPGYVIEHWPQMKASEWYYNDLMREAKKNNWQQGMKIKIKMKGQPGEGGKQGDDGDGDEIEVEFDSFDAHEGWDDIPEEEREFITEKVRQIVERAARTADQQSNGWGNIPSELREQIRKFVSRQVDWRSVLRQFIGKLVRGQRALSIKRINKKYPYIHPGTKRGYQAKLAICMDQSGSVSTEAIELFFGELGSLTRKIDITVIPFDHSVAVDKIFEWKRGSTPKLERVRQGGTCFNAPTKFVNDVKNRGKWDGMIIMTDGECSKPCDSRVRRAWVVCPNHKLMFDTEETVISLTDEPPQTDGPWR